MTFAQLCQAFIKVVFLFPASFICFYTRAQNQPPVISHAQIAHYPQKRMIVVSYDLYDKENDSIRVSFMVQGPRYSGSMLNANELKGDLGFPIKNGKRKKIIWTYPEGEDLGNLVIRLTAADQHKPDLESLVQQVDTGSLKQFHRQIYGIRNHTEQGRSHLDNVRNIIESYFIKNGLITRRQDTTLTKQAIAMLSGSRYVNKPAEENRAYDIQNLIGTKTGCSESDAVVILCAHYDTTHDSPGADDNGSGVAAVLEAVRILSKYSFSKSIMFVAFDLEEEGLLGSQFFVFGGGLKNTKKLEGVINLDMIGYCSELENSQQVPKGYDKVFPIAYKILTENHFKGNFVLSTVNDASQGLGMNFENVVKQYVPQLNIISLKVPGNGLQSGSLAASDHAAFWLAKQPAIFIGDGGETRNKYYHSRGDKDDIVNFSFMCGIVKATIASIADLAGMQHSNTVTLKILK